MATFSENSNYTVLVFYVNERRSVGESLIAEFLRLGFRSSGAATDFSELGSYRDRHRSGDTWISYTERGEARLDDVVAILGDEVPVKGSGLVRSMQRGDLQILLF